MKIIIKNLQFECIIGILDFERKTPQTIKINATFTCKDKPMAIDYAKVVEIIKKLFEKEKFFTVEKALKIVHVELKERFPAIKKAKISLFKPTILPHCNVGAKLCKKY